MSGPDRTIAACSQSMTGRQTSSTAETVGEVAVELRETRLENKRVREKKDNKGAAEYFDANLAHLLNLVRVTNTKDLSPSGRPW